MLQLLTVLKNLGATLSTVLEGQQHKYIGFNIYFQDKRNERSALVEGCERSLAALDCLQTMADPLP